MQSKEYFKVSVQSVSRYSNGKTETKIISFHQDHLELWAPQPKQRLERTLLFMEIGTAVVGEENRVSLFLTSPDSPPTPPASPADAASPTAAAAAVAAGVCVQFTCALESDALKLISHIVCCLEIHLPQLVTQKQRMPLSLQLPAHWQLAAAVAERKSELELPHLSEKCGGFSLSYEFLCTFVGVEAKAEISWDVDTICFAQDSKVLSLNDFAHFNCTDLAAIIASLAFNDYFLVLTADAIKFTPPMIKFLQFALSNNTTLVEISLTDCGLKGDFTKALAKAVASNGNCNLKRISLAKNYFDDKACMRLKSPLSKLSCCLEKLNLSQCGISCKSLNLICDAIAAGCDHNALKFLDISNNDLRLDHPIMLFKILSNSRHLKYFNCEGCNISLNLLAPVLKAGLTQSITDLNLSKNPFFSNNRKGPKGREPQTVCSDWRDFLGRCVSLSRLQLNNCRLPQQALADALLGLAGNQLLQRQSLTVELTANELGQSGSSHVLANCMSETGLPCIVAIDIGDNELDAEVIPIVEAVCQTKIKRLGIGGTNFRSRDMNVIEQFSDIVTAEKCQLESLSIRNANMKQCTAVLLNAIGQCKNLTELDISGNGMGDLGAKILAKSLCLNSNLVSLQLYDNQIGVAGMRDLCESLRWNSTLHSLPLPPVDKSDSLLYRPLLQQLQESLANNRSATQQVTSRDYRLQAELSSCAPSIAHAVSHMESSLRALPAVERGDTEIRQSIAQCRVAISDAEASRFLLDGLSGINEQLERQEESGHLVASMGEGLAAQLTEALNQDLRCAQDNMLDYVADQCQQAFTANSQLINELRSCLRSERCSMQQEAVLQVMQRTLLTALRNKLSTLKLNSALKLNEFTQQAVMQNLTMADIQLTKLARQKFAQGMKALRKQSMQSRRNQRPLSVLGGSQKKQETTMGLVGIDIGDDDVDIEPRQELKSDEEEKQMHQPKPLPRRPRGPAGKRPPNKQPQEQQQQQQQPQQQQPQKQQQPQQQQLQPQKQQQPQQQPKQQPQKQQHKENPKGSVSEDKNEDSDSIYQELETVPAPAVQRDLPGGAGGGGSEVSPKKWRPPAGAVAVMCNAIPAPQPMIKRLQPQSSQDAEEGAGGRRRSARPESWSVEEEASEVKVEPKPVASGAAIRPLNHEMLQKMRLQKTTAATATLPPPLTPPKPKPKPRPKQRSLDESSADADQASQQTEVNLKTLPRSDSDKGELSDSSIKSSESC